MKTFARLTREGARALRQLPGFPSQTFPAHATLATGASAGRHGIINNVFHDRRRGTYRFAKQVSWYEVPPLWIHAQRHGLRSFVYHWISNDGSYQGTQPTRYHSFDPKITDAAKLETVVSWFKLPRDERPDLAMVYLHACDRAGHLYGPASEQLKRCALRIDRQLGQLLDRLRALNTAVTLLIVSDHGMTPTLGDINPLRLLERAKLADQARLLTTGPIGHLYAIDPRQISALQTALRSLPHSRVFRQAELPAKWRYLHRQRSGDLVLVADDGYRFNTAGARLLNPPEHPGHHGHAAEHPDMAGVLFAWGAGIRPAARLARVRAHDVVPTACRLLGITPPGHSEGRVLFELLRRDR